MSEPRGPKRNIVAPAGGQLEWLVNVGEDVKEDQAVCLITSHSEHHIVRSRYTGTIIELVVASKLYVNTGQTLAWVLQIEPRTRPIVVDPAETGSLPPVVIPSGPGTGPQFIPGLDKSPIKIGPSPRPHRIPYPGQGIKIGGEDPRARREGRVSPFIC